MSLPLSLFLSPDEEMGRGTLPDTLLPGPQDLCSAEGKITKGEKTKAHLPRRPIIDSAPEQSAMPGLALIKHSSNSSSFLPHLHSTLKLLSIFQLKF
jgi:hypothetical protein